MKRSKQSIALERLKEIGKATLNAPSPNFYLSADLATVVTGHLDFFLAVAPLTQRLNPVSVSLMGKDLFQMGGRESRLFGEALGAAYSMCLRSGSKATTGQKLHPQVLAVYRASGADGGVKSETMVKSEPKVTSEPKLQSETKVKSETMVKSEPMVKSDSPPAKKLKACLSSPTQIASLYAASSSSVAVKVMGLCVHHKHKHTGCTNMGLSSVCQHIHIYIDMYMNS